MSRQKRKSQRQAVSRFLRQVCAALQADTYEGEQLDNIQKAWRNLPPVLRRAAGERAPVPSTGALKPLTGCPEAFLCKGASCAREAGRFRATGPDDPLLRVKIS